MASLFSLAAVLAAAASAASIATAAEPEVSVLPRLPALSPEQALQSFRLSSGFTITKAAAEPQVLDPVSLSFDSRGALFVAEMGDYSERRAEKLSRVRRLEDKDGDGEFESSSIFMDGLAWATSVLCYHDAVYVAATPDLWRLRDRDGDGVAEEREVIFTGFGEGVAKLNVQALFNSLTLGPDGRIYGAAAANGGLVRPAKPASAGVAGGGISLRGRDFSFDPASLDFRAEPGGGQFGLSFDAWGRRFVCSNSHHIQWIAPVVRGGWLAAPAELVDIAQDGAAAPVFRLSPDEPWRVMRTNWRASGLVPGIVEGGGKASGYFTSASGIHFWRHEAIIADCGSNLVHRKQLRETLDGPVAERPETERDREFLASTDTWFRPVAFTTGPDGALYIADMYREYIEHPDSLPPNLKAKMDLNSGNNRGRIWRVKAEGPAAAARPVEPPPALLREITATPPEKSSAQWKRWWDAVKSHPDKRAAATLLASLRDEAEARDFYSACSPDLPETEALDLAARLRIPPPDNLRELLAKLLAQSGDPAPERLKAVEILARADVEQVLPLATNPKESDALRQRVVEVAKPAAALLLENWDRLSGTLRNAVVASLAIQPEGPALLLTKIREREIGNGAIPPAMAAVWRSSGPPELRRLAAELLPAPATDRSAVIARRQGVLTLSGDAARGAAVFQQRCAVCHRDGESGGFAVGPDRASFRNKGKPLLLLAILDPDREVAPQYARTTLTLNDGSVSAGITVSENPEKVSLMLPGGQETTALRDRIARIDRDAASLMPAGVEEGLSDQELADLLAWLTR